MNCVLFVYQYFTGNRVVDFYKSFNFGQAGLNYHARFSTITSLVFGSKIRICPSTDIDPVSLGFLAGAGGCGGRVL
jgi:hypothetical protein